MLHAVHAMLYAILAELVMGIHFAFILYAVLGALGVLRWPRTAWLHLPVFLWAGAIMLGGWICPLTPLEIDLRLAAGQAGYHGSFIDRYLVAIIYPAALTRVHQIVLGVLVLGWNIGIYLYAWRRGRARLGV
jgi:hypothetical protein